MEQIQPFTEPVLTYSNVTNGFGIVAGTNETTVTYSLPLPMIEK